VKIIAKNEDKQRAIIEKSTKDAASTQARAIGATAALSATPTVTNPSTVPIANRVVPSTSGNVLGTSTTSSKLVSSPSTVATKTPPTAASKNGRIGMVIQPIPPFKGRKPQPTTQPSNNGTQAAAKPSAPGPGVQSTKSAEAAKADVAANKLNVNATSFRPNPKALAFTPVILHRYHPCKLANVLDCRFRLHRIRQWVHQRTRRLRTNLKAYEDLICVLHVDR
jgi:hypothetical protein